MRRRGSSSGMPCRAERMRMSRSMEKSCLTFIPEPVRSRRCSPRVAKKVIGVEIIPEAVEAAKENARLNSLTNCEFIAGDVLKVIDEIEEKPDYIVLDPPRDGIHPKALEKIIRYGVPQMVYISCKPTSLARDLEVLQASGYEVKKVCCVDMFRRPCMLRL